MISRRRLAVAALAAALVLSAFTLAWRYTPLAAFATPQHVTALAQHAARQPWTPIGVTLAYPIAAVVMFPRPLITLFAVVAFGPVGGFALAMAGIATSASSTYLVGRCLSNPTIERLMTPRLRELRAVLRRRGFMGSIAISIVPVAPFLVVGIAAGAMRVKLRDYLPGVLIGHLPGTITTTIFGHQLKAFLEDRGEKVEYLLVLGALVFMVVIILIVRRWYARQVQYGARTGSSRSRPMGGDKSKGGTR